jgi:hypothetical protein
MEYSIFLTALCISIIYLILKLFEQKLILKEVKPFKFLVRDTLFTYMSVVTGLFLLSQFTDNISKDVPEVYINNPNF